MKLRTICIALGFFSCFSFAQTPAQCTAPELQMDQGVPTQIDASTILLAISECQKFVEEAVQFNRLDAKNEALKTLEKLQLMLVLYSQNSSAGESLGVKMDGTPKTSEEKLADEKQKTLNVAYAFTILSEAKDTAQSDRLIPVWRDAAFTYQFYAGVEYGKVDDLFDEASLRLGFQSYVRLADDFEDLRKRAQAGETNFDGFGLYSPHLIGNVVLTGASESAAGSETTASDSSDTPENTENTPDFDAIEYEAALYWPLFTHFSNINNAADYRELTAGLIVAAGGRKTDESDSFLDRYYIGARVSHNEETYFDVLYGKSEPLNGKRLELRGQLPVASVGSGRVFLGGVANIELSRSKDDDNTKVTEVDSFKVYITWQTSFSDLFKSIQN